MADETQRHRAAYIPLIDQGIELARGDGTTTTIEQAEVWLRREGFARAIMGEEKFDALVQERLNFYREAGKCPYQPVMPPCRTIAGIPYRTAGEPGCPCNVEIAL